MRSGNEMISPDGVDFSKRIARSDRARIVESDYRVEKFDRQIRIDGRNQLGQARVNRVAGRVHEVEVDHEARGGQAVIGRVAKHVNDANGAGDATGDSAEDAAFGADEAKRAAALQRELDNFNGDCGAARIGWIDGIDVERRNVGILWIGGIEKDVDSGVGR